MSAPVKPWENVGPNLRSAATHGLPGPLHSSSSVGQVAPPMVRRTVRAFEGGRVAPSIPSRVGSSTYRQGYGRPTTAYPPGNYGVGPYNAVYGGGTAHAYGGGTAHGYGGYGAGYGGAGGAYGGYGSQMYGGSGAYGMNRYPHPQGMGSLESRFIQMAEENSRPAFESIESLVQAFGSVSFMMESTFHAMYSSFRAVLGVAENFGRLRSLFGQVFQTFAVLRLFQWIYRKLLYYLGIRHDNPGREAVWKEATGQLDPKTRRTFWPVAMFLGLVCGGPFLVWRLLKSIGNLPPPADSKTTTQLNSSTSPRTWLMGASMTLPVAIALYDFTAVRENELSIKVGQALWVAPPHLQTPESEWVLVTMNWKESGFVPTNFIEVVEHRKLTRPKPKQVPGVAKQPENPAGSELSSEIASHEVERLGEAPVDAGQYWPQIQGPPPQHARLLEHQAPALAVGRAQFQRAPEMPPQPSSPRPGEPEQTQPAALPPNTDKPVEASS